MAFSLGSILKFFGREGAEAGVQSYLHSALLQPLFEKLGIGGERRGADNKRIALQERAAAEVRDICVDIMYRFNMSDLRARLAADNNHERDVLLSVRARGLRTGELVLVEVLNSDGTKTAMVRSSNSLADPLGIDSAEGNYQEIVAFLNLANYQARSDSSWKQFVQLLHDDTGLESFLRKLPYYRGLIGEHLPKIKESLDKFLLGVEVRSDESYSKTQEEAAPFDLRSLLPPAIILGIMGTLLSISIYGLTAIIVLVVLLLIGAGVYEYQRR